MTEIFVDADACPVKAEVFKVAERHGLVVQVVSNAFMRLPDNLMIKRVIVGDGLDAADDWIAEQIAPGDIVITADVPLAARCVKKGARGLGPTGRPFSEDSIGMAVAVRDLKTGLREAGEIREFNAGFTAKDRSRFLQALEQQIQAIKRQA